MCDFIGNLFFILRGSAKFWDIVRLVKRKGDQGRELIIALTRDVILGARLFNTTAQDQNNLARC